MFVCADKLTPCLLLGFRRVVYQDGFYGAEIYVSTCFLMFLCSDERRREEVPALQRKTWPQRSPNRGGVD